MGRETHDEEKTQGGSSIRRTAFWEARVEAFSTKKKAWSPSPPQRSATRVSYRAIAGLGKGRVHKRYALFRTPASKSPR